jgi:ribonuclease HII
MPRRFDPTNSLFQAGDLQDPSPPSPRPAPEAPGPVMPCWDWEQEAWEQGWRRVAGVDEAGRGPLAGPVVAAAVILPGRSEVEGLRDSKCLSEACREDLYSRIVDRALCWSTAMVEAEEIDRLNILRATHLAMAKALAGLAPVPDSALVDGLPVPGLPCPHRAVVGGDGRCMSIAAASVLAKVTRDRIMQELDLRYPGYGFARHKGYGTRDHLRALRELGPSPCHRRSFRPVAEALQLGLLNGDEFESDVVRGVESTQ